jgi:hypothetical protein
MVWSRGPGLTGSRGIWYAAGRMAERRGASPSPEDLHRIKDEIQERWQQLPPEHQVSQVVVLLSQALEGDYGPWLQGAMEVLAQRTASHPVQVLPIPPLSRGHLALANLEADEIAQFTDGDLRRITQEMIGHYANDVFWEEVEYLAHKTLEEKRTKPPHTQR